ncbi:MAG: hypothetical protein JXA37_06325, partial [Chloroflexia bacterium]|nr:hypothetical protein [Chloroflexia bacterium]
LRFYDDRWRRLADFGTTIETYGRRHAVELDGRAIEVLPLAHPRQAGRLGRASKRWYDLHWGWEEAAGPFQPTRAVF